MCSDLTGRTALVTGVSRRAGIGAAIARELAHAGARLFITFYRRYDHQQTWGAGPEEPEALLRELGAITDAGGIELDLADPAASARLMAQAAQRFGHVDILVNNAAHWEAGGISDVDAGHLDRHYAVNVRATVLLCAEFARQLPSNRPGRIINITSGQGRAPMPGAVAYAVTKSALDALTLTLSAELADRRITVNALDPGPTDTGWISDELRSQLMRITSPQEVARLVGRLAADEGASVTGQIIRMQENA